MITIQDVHVFAGLPVDDEVWKKFRVYIVHVLDRHFVRIPQVAQKFYAKNLCMDVKIPSDIYDYDTLCK